VDERNGKEAAAKGTATHGITKFADLSTTEVSKYLLGYKKKSLESTPGADDYDDAGIYEALTDGSSFSPSLSETTITVMDWSDITTTPVKNQGYCGSCWAFSATEQIESDSIKAGILTTTDALSVEQVVQCDKAADGCDGGGMVLAYYYVEKNGGIQLNSEYPYTSYYGDTGLCSSDSSDFVVTVSAYYYLGSESDMEAHVLNYGPLSVGVDASSWASYTSGILSTCGDSVDHGVQVVGVSLDDSYWKIRNSWGTDWGEDGYIRIESGVNLCDITYEATFTTVSAVSTSSKSKPSKASTTKKATKATTTTTTTKKTDSQKGK